MYGRVGVCDACGRSSLDIARFGSRAQREGLPSPFVATLGSRVARSYRNAVQRGLSCPSGTPSRCQCTHPRLGFVPLAGGPMSKLFAPGLTADGLCLPLPSSTVARGGAAVGPRVSGPGGVLPRAAGVRRFHTPQCVVCITYHSRWQKDSASSTRGF